jgi:hypothetical protein
MFRYSAELLRQWKRQAEDAAHREIGKTPPSAEDAINQAMAVLRATPGQLVPNAMANTSAAISNYLAIIDPSLRITPEFAGGHTNYVIEAIAPVEVSLTATGDAALKLSRAVASVLSDGDEVSVPLEAVTISGSPAIALLVDGATSLVLAGADCEAVVRVMSPDRYGGDDLTIEFVGDMRRGSDWMTLTAAAFKGVMSLKIRLPLPGNPQKASWTMQVTCDPWLGRSLSELAQLDRIARFVDRLRDASSSKLEIEVDGRILLQSTTRGPLEQQDLKSVTALVGYVLDVRDICEILSVEVFFSEMNVSLRETQQIRLFADLLRATKGSRPFRPEDEFTMPVGLSDELAALLAEPTNRLVRWVTPDADIKVFGQAVRVPSLTSFLSCMQVSLLPGNVSDGQANARIAQFRPTLNSQLQSFFTAQAVPISVGDKEPGDLAFKN